MTFEAGFASDLQVRVCRIIVCDLRLLSYLKYLLVCGRRLSILLLTDYYRTPLSHVRTEIVQTTRIKVCQYARLLECMNPELAVPAAIRMHHT
jgi:hypothetical protein